MTDFEIVFDEVKLWRADSIVLYDWLMTVGLDNLPLTNRAQRQALTDLLTALQGSVDVHGVTAEDIANAQAQVWRDDGWLARFDDGPLSGQIQTVELDALGAPPARLNAHDQVSPDDETATAVIYEWDEQADTADGFHYRVVGVE